MGRSIEVPEDATPSRRLAEFASGLRFDDLPATVVRYALALLLDWYACALAGRGARPVQALEHFAERMGPTIGASQLLTTRRGSSPLFAALVNAAASHVVEQDDLHNSSVLHPATVVFPSILAMVQSGRYSGKALIAAAVAGYETGVRVGEFLGRSHYEIFHTTGTAGTPAAAAAVGNLLELDAERMGHALGSAGTQAAGLWEFLRDAADSKQLHTAKAAADGLTAACLAAEGLTAARQIFEGAQGMGAGMCGSGDAACLTDGLGSRWALLETSFKFHASCRHTHPAADALLQLVDAHELHAKRIGRIRAHVYQAAADVLGRVVEPRTVHQAKFSMGFVLALIAQYRRAGVDEFTEAALRDPVLRDLHQCVEMIVDPDIDALYPWHWAARVEVDTIDGETLSATVHTPKGDPDNPLTHAELESKAHTLAAFGGAASRGEMDRIIETVWRLPELENAGDALRLPARATVVPPETHREIRTALGELCARFPDDYWRELDGRRAYPEDFVAALTEAGWLAALIPEEYGGSGLGITEASVILEQINRCGGNAGACHAQMYTMGTILRHGSESQKRRHLPRIASGKLRLQAFGVTEPSTGSDTTRLKSTAIRRGDRYLVNGQKVFTSRVQHSDLMLLLARTTPREQVERKSDGLSVFLVDLRDAPAGQIEVVPIDTMMNHETNQVFFSDLEVPAENLIGEQDRGFRYILDGMNAERILIAAECIGDADWFLERACTYAGERVVFDRPIGRNQGVQFPLARAYANTRAADLMRYDATARFDAGEACGAQANMAKLLAADASWEAANAAIQTHGGYGFARDYDIERKFRETRLYQIAPISTNLILSYLAEHVLGLPRSY